MKKPSIYSRLSRQARIRAAAFLHAIVVSLGVDVPLEAATKEWSGNDLNDSNWTSNNNWDGIGGAQPGDALVFPDGAGRLSNINDFPLNTTFNSLNFERGGYVINGTAGAGISIILTNGIIMDNGGGDPFGPDVFNPNIFLGANQTWTSGTLSNLTLNGVVNLNGHNLTITGTNITGGFLMSGQITGASADKLTKSGNSTLTVAGNSSAFGGTVVTSGPLLVTGSLGLVTFQGGRLVGTGTVGGITATGGTIDPGVDVGGGGSRGILTSTGVVTLNNVTTLEMDIEGTTAGTDHDQLVVSGANINLNNAVLATGNSFADGHFIPDVGDQFTIVSQTGAGSIIGQFFGPGAQGTSLNVHGQLFTIAYTASSVILTAQGQFLSWDGGSSNNDWSNATNWDFDVVPANAQNLTFPPGAPADSLNNNNNIAGLRLGKLTFNTSGYNISGNAIELGQGIINNATSGLGSAIALNIKLLLPQTFLNNGPTTTTLTGQVDLTANGNVLTIDGSGSHVINGQIIGTAPIGSGGIIKNGTGTLSLFTATNTYTGQTLINSGTVRISSPNSFGATGSGNNTVVFSGATLTLEGNVTNVPEVISLNGTGVGGTGALNAVVCNVGCSMASTGLQTDSTINVPTGSHTLTLAGQVAVGTVGLTKIGAGTLILSGNSTSTGTTTVSAGTLLVNGNNSSSPVNITGGTVGGTGTVGAITAANGTVAPGASAGTLNVSGNVTFNSGATLKIEIGGLNALTDLLNVTGTVNLGPGVSTLTGSFINGFTPTPGQNFTIIQSTGAITGTFAQGSSVTIGGTFFTIGYGANSVQLTAQGGPSPTPTATATATPTATATATSTPAATATATPTATPDPTSLANISTRLRVETGDNVLIGGFIITGTQPKKVIALATGPSLTALGIPGALANPTLELFQGNSLIDSNDNWVDSQNKQAIIDSGVAPTNDLESAIIATLPANNAQYTAIVRGVNNGTGVGTVQFFDLDRLVDSKLANISTRGLVQTGDNVLIAGTIVLGATPQKVIVRAIGPSLPFAGVLPDPTLELRTGDGTLLDSNDNWKDSPNKQAIIDSTIPPTNDAESAIVQTLPASGAQYTAIVRGVGGTTGIAVVEVFALD